MIFKNGEYFALKKSKYKIVFVCSECFKEISTNYYAIYKNIYRQTNICKTCYDKMINKWN